MELLNLYSNCHEINLKEILQISKEITRIDAHELSYNDFFWKYMNENIPLIITSTSEKWLCREQWISTTSGINFTNLKVQIKNLKVPVANCSKEYYNSHEKSEMNFYDYLDYWEQRAKDANENTLYLKDWHLKANMPDYDFYRVPKYFASDWLNEYLIDTGKDDYRFVYMGPQGSWTPFHADVFSSYSWSTNIFGLKKWIFIIPPDELKLMDAQGNDPFTINEHILLEKDIKFVTIIQKENESIFVPSGWYHQVWNLTDTISINHNWFNGCNIECIWRSLSDNMQKVISEIEDCRDMENFEGHCQTMLRATFGMNYNEFFDILDHIAQKRKLSLEKEKAGNLFDIYQINNFHILNDLRAINEITKAMKRDQTVKKDIIFLSRCDKLVSQLQNCKFN